MRDGSPHDRTALVEGFTVVELMLVLLIIGVLAAIAIPVLVTSAGHAQRRACFASQRSIEGVVILWQLDPSHTNLADLAGVVDADHPLVTGRHLVRAPRCASAPSPANPDDPGASEGAYALDASGSVEPCTFGAFGAHGSFRNE